MHLRQVDIRSANILSFGRCKGSLKQSTVLPTIEVSDAQVEVDRVRGANWSIRANSNVKVTNSVFENGRVQIAGDDSQIRFAFNTFYFPNNEFYIVDCAATASPTNLLTLFENNIFVGGPGDVIRNSRCITNNNILFPQLMNYNGTNIKLDPQFVDAAAGDYRLKATSPAVDAALPSSGLSTTYDFEGAARPQGPSLDIGAFERSP